MELKYLQTFQAVVREGSFTGAASKLNYTQSTITFQIQQLEREFSAPLFEKVGRRMALTQAGRRLVPRVEEALSSLDRLYGLEEDLAECRGDLHIGVGETLLCYRLPALLKEFTRRAPNARLFLRSLTCRDIRDGLLDGSLDLGVFYEEVGGYGSSLTTYSMGAQPLALLASPGTAARCPDFITPDRRLPAAFLIDEPTCIFRELFERYLAEKAIVLDHTIELWSIPTIKNLVKNDVGVTYLPLFAAQEELDSGALVEIPTDIQDGRITAVCAHSKNKWVSPLMRAFIEACGG